MTTNGKPAGEESLQRQRLVDLVVFEYRSLVVRRLGVTAEWRLLEWTDEAACYHYQAATQATCARCPVSRECLAAALATDDRAEWRGGVNRADRESLWAGLERTYREVRDFELMRIDVSRLSTRDRPGGDEQFHQRSKDRAASSEAPVDHHATPETSRGHS